VSGLAIDAVGNLYGTTRDGGSNNLGSVYQLTPNLDGSWTQSLPYSFGSQSLDGTQPYAEVTLNAGNLYGTTFTGGAFGFGTVFKLSSGSGGAWTESVVYNFTGGRDQGNAVAAVWLDSAGDVFGTTPHQVGNNYGTAFMLTPNADGSWSYKTLHAFGTITGDAVSPESGLTADGTGHLFGTTSGGGTYNKGAVYELSRGANGKWAEKVLVSLDSFESLPSTPPAVTLGRGHILYGVISSGGSSGYGVVFAVTP